MTETRDPTGTTVRSLMESYEHGEINFPTLLEAMRAHTCLEGPERPKDWAEVWERAEEMPDDDDDPFWVYVAADLGVITEEEDDELLAALEEVGSAA